MADNVTLNAGAGGSVLRTKDRAGVETSIVALDLNPAGAETLMAGAMPVTGTFWQATQPVSGTVTVNAGTGTFGISGSVSVSNFPATQAVTGTFWQTTQPVSLATLPTLAAGTNLIGQASASNETSTVYNGATALTPQFATIVASASGATTVVALTAGKRIRVLRWSLSANGAVNVKWQSHVTPTDLTGLHYLTQFAAAGGAYCPVGIFQTNVGEALDINLSAAIAVGGELTYILV